MIFTLMTIFAVILFGFGWVGLLVWGLIRRKKDKTSGMVLAIIGGLWGFAALALVGLGFFVSNQMSKSFRAEQFDPSRYHGQMGKLILDYPGAARLTASRESDGKRMEFRFKDGAAKAPVGRYCMDYLSVSSIKGNDYWSIMEMANFMSSRRSGAPATSSSKIDEFLIEVKAKTPAHLSAALPLTAEVSVNKVEDRKVILSLNVTDSLGRPASISRAGSRRYAGFEVLSDSGKVLWQGNFQPG